MHHTHHLSIEWSVLSGNGTRRSKTLTLSLIEPLKLFVLINTYLEEKKEKKNTTISLGFENSKHKQARLSSVNVSKSGHIAHWNTSADMTERPARQTKSTWWVISTTPSPLFSWTPPITHTHTVIYQTCVPPKFGTTRRPTRDDDVLN